MSLPGITTVSYVSRLERRRLAELKQIVHKIGNLSISKKYLLVVITSVVGAIALLSFLVVRREINLITLEYQRDASIVTTAISKALHDNMQSGFPDATLRLLRELSNIDGVMELAVLRPNGSYAMGMTGPFLDISRDSMVALNRGQDVSFSASGSWYFMKPLLNEQGCRTCHGSSEMIRGIVLCRMSSEIMEQRRSDLLQRMTFFGIVTALVLSGLLSIFSRKMLLLPLKGLTDAARQIAQGDFILFRPRGTKCHELTGCDKNGCPSYADDNRPCWLISGNLCASDSPGRGDITSEDCLKCRVYRSLKGDEIRELQDSFNIMSLALKNHEEKTRSHIAEIEGLNRSLTRSNIKLETLLEASRHTTSTLELDRTLSSLLKIMLDVTGLKAGLVLLKEEDRSRRCYEYFGCEAYNCPAYKSDTNCWRLPGTMCHSESLAGLSTLTPRKFRDNGEIHTFCMPVMNFGEKIRACSSCDFFAGINFVPRMASGYSEPHIGRKLKIDSLVFKTALLKGETIISHSGDNPFHIPMEALVEMAMPLRIHDKIIGMAYLISDMTRDYGRDEIEFFQYLSEVITSGVMNSKLFEDMEVSYFQTVMALANAVEAKDSYTRGHSERVAELSLRTADLLGLSRQEKDQLRYAALLHDIGKIGISLSLLRKKAYLDHDEKRDIMSHPDRGAQILSPIHFLKPIIPAVRHHHEKFDGTGYPLGLRGRAIPLKARIICVADAWDAMMSNRPYRDALDIADVRKEIRLHTGTQFDPEVVDAFLKSVEDLNTYQQDPDQASFPDFLWK